MLMLDPRSVVLKVGCNIPACVACSSGWTQQMARSFGHILTNNALVLMKDNSCQVIAITRPAPQSKR